MPASRVKAHVDQFHVIGGLELALEFNALSVDHLEASGPEQVAALAASDTVGVLLPGVTLHLGIPAAPGRALIDAGAAVAVGTDLNPGSSPLFSTQLAMALAVRINRLSVCEALTAVHRQCRGGTGPARYRPAPARAASRLHHQRLPRLARHRVHSGWRARWIGFSLAARS